METSSEKGMREEESEGIPGISSPEVLRKGGGVLGF